MSGRGDESCGRSVGVDFRRALAFVFLFLFAVPWYWRYLGPLSERRIAGLPIWFVGTVAGSAAISALAAWCFHEPWTGEGETHDASSTGEHDTSVRR